MARVLRGLQVRRRDRAASGASGAVVRARRSGPSGHANGRRPSPSDRRPSRTEPPTEPPASRAPASSRTVPEAPRPRARRARHDHRGAGAAIAANMERSLAVPTATSFRNVPAKLLEVNRKVINGYRERSGMGKVSFTHLIGYAVVRAIADAVPAMRNTFVEGADGKPRIIKQRQRQHGSRRRRRQGRRQPHARRAGDPRGADHLDFAGFLVAYEELIRKVKANKLTVEDFQGANVSLTNPGTIGTVQSVPRLMPGQGVIVGVGTIDYPAEFEGADRANLSSLGISKVVTITSTYDHRIIQGAESGMFLKRVHELLLGEHGFYDDVFAAPRHALRGGQVAPRRQPDRPRGGDAAEADAGRHADPRLPRPRPPHRRPRPAALEGAGHAQGARPGDVRPDDLGPRPRVPHRRRRRRREDGARRAARRAARRLLPHDRHRVHAHPGHRGAALDPVQGRGPPARRSTRTQKHRILERLNAAEAFEKFLATKYVGTKRFGLEGAESAIPILDEVLSGGRRRRARSAACSAWPTAAGSTCCPTSSARATTPIFREFEGHVDPESVQGSGDVKYHLGATGKYVSPTGADIRLELAANPSHLETVDPIVVGMVRAAQDRIEPPGSYPVLPILHPRRRRVRRPGRRRRDAGDERHQGLPRRRHDPPDHQQPDRLHHRPRVRPLVAVLQRRRQDGAGADLPRQRRRPRGVRAGRPAGVRVPPAVPQGRRHRHVVLPPPRPQRGRRPQLHAAADVQGDRRAPQRAQALRRGARQAWRHHGRGGRAGAGRLPGQAAGRPRRDPGSAPGAAQGGRGRRKPTGVLPHVPTGVERARLDRDLRPPHGLPGGVHAPPQAGSSSSRPAPSCYADGEVDWAHGRGAGHRLAASSRATRCGSPARTPGGARSATATPR